jgi:hypothetical protein
MFLHRISLRRAHSSCAVSQEVFNEQDVQRIDLGFGVWISGHVAIAELSVLPVGVWALQPNYGHYYWRWYMLSLYPHDQGTYVRISRRTLTRHLGAPTWLVTA